MIVWALIDDKVSINGQTIAVAERLARYYVLKKITFNYFGNLPSAISSHMLMGVNKNKSDDISTDFPDVIISAGNRLPNVALNIKRRADRNVFLVNIGDPGSNYDKFDLIFVSRHDDLPKKLLSRKNVVQVNGVLRKSNRDKIKEESEIWKDFTKIYTRPIISLMVGGDTQSCKYDAKEFGVMVSNLSNIVNRSSGTLLVATSKRTNDDCMNQIRLKVNCDHYIYDWKMEENSANVMRNPLGNPYYAFLGSSDFIVITGDSISRIIDACSTGRSVYVYMPKNDLSKVHNKFCRDLVEGGHAREFTKYTADLEKMRTITLNELERVTDIIYRTMERRK